MNSNPFSVLMSVYCKEAPDNLNAAIDSVFNQTLKPSELILVKDGPLPSSLLEIIDSKVVRYSVIRVLSLDENVGLGAALNIGLAACSYELVARMDSDDISVPYRFESQIPVLAKHPDFAVVGSWISEFESDPTKPSAMRTVPELSADIKKFARYRSPFNHPAVVFRKSCVQSVGGYNAKYQQEDYYLWVRLILAGYSFCNIPRALVLMRTGKGLYKRRGGIVYAKSEIKLFFEFYRIGFIGLNLLVANILSRILIRIIPSGLRKSIYFVFARMRPGNSA